MAWLTAQLGDLSSIGDDDVWVVDSTPVECGRSKETVKRSDLAGWAEYGYCASHSRYFWGLRLHLVCTLHGLPVGWVLTGAKADEREAFWAIAESTATIAHVLDSRQRQTMIADKNYFGHAFESDLVDAGIDLLRPARKGEKPRPGSRFFRPLRQIIESVNDTVVWCLKAACSRFLEPDCSHSAGGRPDRHVNQVGGGQDAAPPPTTRHESRPADRP